MQKESELIFTEENLISLITRLATPDTLIVTDAYNYPALNTIAPTVSVDDQEIEYIEKIEREHSYKNVIGVGGCTALDAARACAIGKNLIVVPTILSNSCISVNRSVIKRGGVYKSEETTSPRETIISMPVIADNHVDQVKNWSASGLGDLFSSISASIEVEYVARDRSLAKITAESVAKNIPACMQALEWVLNDFVQFDRPSLKLLARYLHEASLDIIRNGHTRLAAASEHWLYYRMQERQHYPKMIATHGRLISMGNLITLRIFAEATSDFSLYEKMRTVYTKIGLPLTYADLLAIGVEKQHIIAGLEDIAQRDCLYNDYFSKKDHSILDRIFG
jgi:glycerol dehydrogenase-like iron-containing ADH family enzyme